MLEITKQKTKLEGVIESIATQAKRIINNNLLTIIDTHS